MYILLKIGNTCTNKLFKEDNMRRENRGKKLQPKTSTDKIILYAEIGVAILAIVVFALFMYSKNLSKDVKDGTMSLEQLANIANNTQNTESASTQIGKSVQESSNTNITNNTTTNTTNHTTNTKTSETKSNQINTNKSNTTNTTNTTKAKTNTNITTNANVTPKETKKELSFEKPVEGEVVREYAQENLIYSETLKEWTTHAGIDIKADKTTVVKAAESGTVKSIKNDPRYGLTIVIEHDNHMQTVYSNLLTSEFVVEGEKVEKGQSIGTVGNTAVFEIADEPHLHFEILQDSLPVDPNAYIK